MIRLYMDENVEDAITARLRELGVDVLAVREDGFASADDHSVFTRANELGRTLFSRDRDMIVEASRCHQSCTNFTGVIYARQRVVTVGQCISDLELVAKVSEPADMENRIFYLPL
jgi:predicted nuclease of predicted toxin-antitoxin system